MLKYCFLTLFLFTVLQLSAQQQDSVLRSDTSKKSKSFNEKFSSTTKEIGSLFKDTTTLQPPRKAVFRSAIIPGWGQARNHKWWKVPLVYAGFIGLGIVYDFNNRYYKIFLNESQFRKSTDKNAVSKYPEYQSIPDDQIYSAKDFYRRNRDLTLYSMGGFYLLQIVDAYIDARLATFDVGDDLSFKIKPSIYLPSYATNSYYAAPVPMLTLRLNLNR
ncbi:MAG: DUF5683 domain-containing protein [Pelobium sp.]